MLNVNNLHGELRPERGAARHRLSPPTQDETVAIMGRNGMGKTTLFKALIGMLPLKSGPG